MADPVAEMEIRRGDYDDMRLEGGVGARGLGCCGGGERMAESRRCELADMGRSSAAPLHGKCRWRLLLLPGAMNCLRG